MVCGSRDRQWTPVDETGCVAVDLPCANCGYNLRTQPADGDCPECGHPVEPSTRSYLLRDAPHDWLASLAAGAGMLVLLLFPTDVFFLARTLSLAKFGAKGDTAVWWIWCCGPLLIGGVMVALALLAVRDPFRPARETREGLSARRVILYGLWSLPLGWLCAEAFRFVAPGGAAYVGNALLFGAAQTCCWVLLPWAVMQRLSNLLRRVPASFLAAAAKGMAYLFALDGLATAAALVLWRFPITAAPRWTPASGPASYTPELGALRGYVEQALVAGPALSAILGAFGVWILMLARGRFRAAAEQARRSRGAR